MRIFGFHVPGTARTPAAPTPPATHTDAHWYGAVAGSSPFAQPNWAIQDGDKFLGGFGDTRINWKDYWTLRARSVQLFEENLYARGIVRRLITNEINTGLTLEALPESLILGIDVETLRDWSDGVEARFTMWSERKDLVDYRKQRNFAELQRTARMQALIDGDVLVVERIDRRTGLPMTQLIDGAVVQSPIGTDHTLAAGHEIKEGVELDPRERQVAYWIRKKDNTFERLPAYGSRSGRRIAWLMYGIENRMCETRGTPLLALILQSMRELDRYRDSTQRKAVLNSMLAMFIKKDKDKMGSLPMQGSAVRRDTVDGTTDGGTPTQNVRLSSHIPGLIIEELQVGEEPQGFGNQGIDEKFGDFEEAILQGIAWALEIPPEILRLSFSSNYSASQAALQEFKIYLNKARSEFATNFCQPIYVDWLIGEVLNNRVIINGFVEAWRNPAAYDVYGAWIQSDWTGAIKPSTDPVKQVKAMQDMVDAGFITRTRAARELTGTKFDRNVQILARENAALVEANRPMVELENPPAPEPVEPDMPDDEENPPVEE